uniref:Uncharacterized protein n=1 Tax=Setaria italica TaxID=4555 RepID=K3YE48_SETIT
MNTLFSMANDLSQEYIAHVIVIVFSPTGEHKACGAPTADSILHTYLPKIHSSSCPACSETAGEATARFDGMNLEIEETAFLPWWKGRMSMGEQNWWEVDVEALRAVELPVFVKALEVLRTNVQCHLNAMESS